MLGSGRESIQKRSRNCYIYVLQRSSHEVCGVAIDHVLDTDSTAGLDIPLLLLPFRPSSDPSAARTFVRNFFFPPNEREPLTGRALANELRMTEVMVCGRCM